ncbi:hypothetical protein DPMN_193940 [Dreissena polymorpha]|uniref:Uncharacterized protein n=1 Tax=Dreissena polymorpha TaxID=45954 RepID=A0A9D3Y5H6_DREPO|nr:hypothetical protein DPMN_193940 [Dreissena polymorpha]
MSFTSQLNPDELVFCIYKGQYRYGEEPLVVVVETAHVCWLLDDYVLSITDTNCMGDIQPLFELLFKVSPCFRGGRCVENLIFIRLYNDRAHFWNQL